MKKRWASAVLAVIMLMAIPAHATTAATVSCTVRVEQNGQSAELEVAIADNPGIASWLINLAWDESVGEYDSIEYGQAFSNGMFVKNSSNPGKLTVIWYGASNVSTDGTMFKAKLKTDGTAEKGATVSLTYSPEDTVNEKGERVALSVVSSVTIPAPKTGSGDTAAAGSRTASPEDTASEKVGQAAPGDVGSVTVPASKAGSEDTAAVESGTAGAIGGHTETPAEGSAERAERAEGQSSAPPANVAPVENDSGQSQALSPVDKPKAFTDVKETDYFFEAVNWALKEKITGGVSENEFNPGGVCTRAQAVTFLWRAAGSPEPAFAGNLFSDVSSDQYYYKAVMWAVENEITLGTGDAAFSPDATVTRGQLVTFLWRSAGKEASGSASVFQDVGSNDYFAVPVSWAVSREITLGTGQGTFSPNATCTRAQTVTFLFRFASARP